MYKQENWQNHNLIRNVQVREPTATAKKNTIQAAHFFIKQCMVINNIASASNGHFQNSIPKNREKWRHTYRLLKTSSLKDGERDVMTDKDSHYLVDLIYNYLWQQI
jgi:hypothetical protein